MIADRTADEVLIRCTVREACLIAQALDGYGDAIDSRCTPLAAVLCPSKTRQGIVTVDELDEAAQSAPGTEASEDVDAPSASIARESLAAPDTERGVTPSERESVLGGDQGQ